MEAITKIPLVNNVSPAPTDPSITTNMIVSLATDFFTCNSSVLTQALESSQHVQHSYHMIQISGVCLFLAPYEYEYESPFGFCTTTHLRLILKLVAA
jgi:hypothetical protein